MDTAIFDKVDQYISDLFHDEDEVLKSIPQSIEAAGMPHISVSPNQGKFLFLLAKLAGATRILEIGTLAGYSTIWMARAMPESGWLLSLEFDPLHARVARENLERAGLTRRVEVREGRALDLLPDLLANDAGPFDMIFIDADKPPYTEYFEWALRLSKPGTLIIADNVIREGKVLQPEPADEMVAGVKRFNTALAACDRVSATILQTVGAKEHDGMALAIVKG